MVNLKRQTGIRSQAKRTSLLYNLVAVHANCILLLLNRLLTTCEQDSCSCKVHVPFQNSFTWLIIEEHIIIFHVVLDTSWILVLTDGM